MTQEQEIRAWALLIAEVKNRGNFSNLNRGEKYVVELNDRQLAYLEAIGNYISESNHRPVSDNGRPFSCEVGWHK